MYSLELMRLKLNDEPIPVM